MNGLRAFFSFAGPGSALRFAFAAVVGVAVLWACSRMDPHFGVLPNIVAGAIAGVAVAKMMIEAVRWSWASGGRGSPSTRADGAGLVVGLTCAVIGAFIVGGISYISIGMAEQNKRAEARQAKMDEAR